MNIRVLKIVFEQNRILLRSIIKNLSLGLILYVGIICLGKFSTVIPDGALRIELTHSLVTQGTVITSMGPIKYAPLQSFLMAPIYAMGYYYGVLSGEPSQKFQGIGELFVYYLFLPVITSVLCVLFFRISKRMGSDDNASLISTFLLFCGTFFLPYVGGMYSETLNALLILISFYYFYTAPATDYISSNRKNFICLGVLILNNFIFLPYFGLMMAYVFWSSWVKRNNPSEAWRIALEGLSVMSVSVVLFLFYNFGRYDGMLDFGYQGEGFTGNWLVGIYGLMFSSGKGLLVFSPLTVLCILYFLFKNHEMESWQKYVFSTMLISFFVYVSIYAKWDSWHGGMCWGPRFLLPFVPVIHLMFPLLLKSLSYSNRMLQAGLLVVIAWAVGMNLLNYLDHFAVIPSDAMTVTAEEFSQRLLTPEKSVIVQIWNNGIISLDSLRFLATLGACGSLLWLWKKKFGSKPPVSQSPPKQAF